MNNRNYDCIIIISVISGLFITTCDYLVQMKTVETDYFVSRLLSLEETILNLSSFGCIFTFIICNNLTLIIVSKNNPEYKSTNNCMLTKDGKELILCRSHNIPDGVTKIGRWAFDGCTSLQSIVIPDSVTTIAHNAFCDCISLQSITIATQEKKPDMSREKIEYLLHELSEYSKEISLRVPIGCGYAYRHHTAFEGKFKTIIADIDA